MRFFQPEIERILEMLGVIVPLGLMILPIAWGDEQRRQARTWQAVLVSNTTAPVHVDAAAGTPVVDLDAPVNPQHTPRSVPHRVLFHDVSCKDGYESARPAGHHDRRRRAAPRGIVDAGAALVSETRRPVAMPAAG